MNIWHDTVDAPRWPRRVSPGHDVEVVAGTWPIGPGQSVTVAWQLIALYGSCTEGVVVAEWQRNVDVNSYWTAHFGPFADGDCVTYTVQGTSPDGTVQTVPVSFRVKPCISPGSGTSTSPSIAIRRHRSQSAATSIRGSGCTRFATTTRWQR